MPGYEPLPQQFVPRHADARERSICSGLRGFDFSMANLSAVYVGHSFEYSSLSKITDKERTYTGQNATTGTKTATSSAGAITTRAILSIRWRRATRSDVISQAGSSSRHSLRPERDRGNTRRRRQDRHHTYSQFELKRFPDRRYAKVNKTSYFFYSSISGR